MKTFTDDEMNALLPTAKPYSVMILKRGPNFGDDAAPARSSGSMAGATSGYVTTAHSRWCCRFPMAPISAGSECSPGPSTRPSRS
jgi:hypothetical protein